MFTIKKATTNDIQLINEMAQIVFPATYREILSKEQLDYMSAPFLPFETIR